MANPDHQGKFHKVFPPLDMTLVGLGSIIGLGPRIDAVRLRQLVRS